MTRAIALAYLALAWCLGIAAAAFTGGESAAAVAAWGLLASAGFAWRPRAGMLVLALAAIPVVALASLHYEGTVPDPSPALARFNDGPAMRVRGIVADEPDERPGARLYRLNVSDVRVGEEWQQEDGRVLVRGGPYPEYEYGDVLEVDGRLETPPVFEDFDYRDYLLRRGIVAIMNNPDIQIVKRGEGDWLREKVIEARHSLSGALSDVLPEPQASLAAGILFGARSQIPADLRDDMNATGTSHLVAVSGQNVTLLAGLVIAALSWFVRRRQAAWLSLAAIVLYAALVGGQPSVFRASLMGAIYVMSIAAGRQNTGIVALVVAAAGMTIFHPQVVHEVSFQLSLAATTGLLTFAPALRRHLDAVLAGLPALRPAGELLSVTLAAIAFTLPITAINFHRVSLVAPLANLLAVPAFIAVAFTSALAAGTALVLPFGDGWLTWLAWPAAAYMAFVIRVCADLPLASAELRGLSVEHAIAYYAVLVAAVWLLARRPAEAPEPAAAGAPPALRRLLPALGLGAMAIAAVVVAWVALSPPDGDRLSVTFLDVGQGDAILIEGPQGHRVLVDGGPSEAALDAALGRHLPFDDRRIDLVIVTHPQLDHIGGLPPLLADYDVRGVLDAGTPGETAAYDAWQNALGSSGISYTRAALGQAIDLGDGARLQVIGPPPGLVAPELNDTSTVLRLSMDGVAFLLTGDIGEEAETALVRAGIDLDAQVLKVAHHGSRFSTTPEFLSRVTPLVGVISAGADNPYGHPARELLERLDGGYIFRTDENGDVTVTTDGERIWVETQRRAK